jgi:F-type H+-transporting ATPase subunit gamma
MASVQQLKSRIRSVNSTKQITGAMQLVAASKMRRAIESATATHDYTFHASELMRHLANICHLEGHPLFQRRPIKRRLLVVISSDTGLAGAYNSNLFKTYIAELKRDQARGVTTETLALGRKISQFAARLAGNTVIGTYNFPEDLSHVEFGTIINTILEGYRTADYDAVDVISTTFVSAIKQEVEVRYLLPIGHVPGAEDDTAAANIKFEPSPHAVMEAVSERLIRAEIVQRLSDAAASEHSMRMMAMKNATDNATDLVDDLTLAMNKERQAAITQEISEISNGAEAVE